VNDKALLSDPKAGFLLLDILLKSAIYINCNYWQVRSPTFEIPGQ